MAFDHNSKMKEQLFYWYSLTRNIGSSNELLGTSLYYKVMDLNYENQNNFRLCDLVHY